MRVSGPDYVINVSEGNPPPIRTFPLFPKSINRLTIEPRKYSMKISQTFTFIIALLLGAYSSLTAYSQDSADGSFHDDLLDHLVGQWEISAVAHGRPPDKGVLAVEWVFNHQFLRIYEKGTGNIPGMNTPFEGMHFIGFDRTHQRYVSHLVCIRGGAADGLSYGSRTGNEIKLVYNMVQRFTWMPESHSWLIGSRSVKAGKEDEPFLEITATSAHPLRSESK